MATSLAETSTMVDDLVGRARELAPGIRARMTGYEGFKIPAETVQELKDADLLRVATPARWGGYEGLDYDAACQVAFELARADMSTGWCYNVWLSHILMVAEMPMKAQAEYWATGPNTLSSTASAPVWNTTRFTDEGYVTSGRWKFASGSDYSDWIFCPSTATIGATLLPREQLTIHDNWRTIGLRATGSNDVSADNVFVPPYRLWSPMDSALPGGPPGWNMTGRASHRLPMWIVCYAILVPVVGAARGAVDTFRNQYHALSAPAPSGPASTRKPTSQPLQITLAEAAAEVDMADLLWRTDLRSVLDQAAAGVPFDTEARARVKRNQAFAARLAVRAVTRLFEATGAHAIDDGNPLQRFFRDVHAGSHHVALPWEASMASYGHATLGLPFAMDVLRDGIDPALRQF